MKTIVERLRVRAPLLGMLQTQPNPSVTELAYLCGYDFVMLDAEHGFFREWESLSALQVLSATNTAAFVRLPECNAALIGRYLDMGVHGLIVPGVRTEPQAKSLASGIFYPPRGFGASLHRATRYGADLASHWEKPGGLTSLFVLIESAEAVQNAKAILSIDGIDGAIVGPFDLSADLGCCGRFDTQSYRDALTRIREVAGATGKMLGTAPHPGYPAELLAEQGFELLIIAADMSAMREAMQSKVSATRASLRGGRSKGDQ